MEGDEDFDTHICLACQVPILGLDNYVYHKKVSCPSKRRTEKPDKVEASSEHRGTSHQSAHAIASSSVQMAGVPNLSVFGSHLMPQPTVSQPQIYQPGNEATSQPQTTLFDATLTQSDLVTSTPHVGYMQQAPCGSELSVLVDTHHLNNQTNGSVGCDTPTNAVTTFSTTPSRFNVVDPNMVLKHHLPAPVTETSEIMPTTDANSPPNLSQGNPSILDFLSSLELQCRATPSQGKAIPGVGAGEDGKMPDGLKIASLLKDLNFDSDSDGFDMPSDAEDLLDFDEEYLDSTCGSYGAGKGKGGHGKGKSKILAHKGGKKGRYTGKWRPGERPHSGKSMASRSVSIGKRQYEDMSSDDDHEPQSESAQLPQDNKLTGSSDAGSPSPKKARPLREDRNTIPGRGVKIPQGVEPSGEEAERDEYESTVRDAQVFSQDPISSQLDEQDDIRHDEDEDDVNPEDGSVKHSKDTRSKEHQCEPCVKSFKNRSALHNHIRSEEHKHLASLTAEEREKWLSQRQEQKNATQSFQCPSCQRDFNNKYNFARHLLSALHLKKSKTTIIQLDATFQKLLLRLQPFQCRICQFFCTTAENLQEHLKSDDHSSEVKELVGPMCCRRCKFISRNEDDIVSHFQSTDHRKKISSSDRPCVLQEVRANLTCQFCDKKIHSASAMQKHLASQHKSLADRGSKSTLKSSVCPECFKDCKTKYNMQVHMRRSHTRDRPYSCDICKKRFLELSTFNMHCKSQKHVDNLLRLSSTLGSPGQVSAAPKSSKERSKLFKCKDCDFSCSSYSELRPHYIEEHCSHAGDRKARSKSHVCEICGYRFHAKSLLTKHMETDRHKEKEKQAEASGFVGLPCTHCEHKFYSKEKLSLHLLSHMSTRDENSSKKLPILSGVPQKFHSFVQHLPKKKKARNRELPCPECNALLKVSNMVVHLRSHGDPNDQPYKCSFCSKTFTSNSCLYRHHRSHLGVRPFECSYCSKTFCSGPGLNSHLLAAHPAQTDIEAKYQCQECDLKFVQKHRYMMHIKYHEKHKQYKCDFPGCKKSFVLATTLRDHARVHTGEKPYLCDFCGFATKTQTHMSRHRRMHTGECNYQCQYCTFRTSFSWGLRRHMRIHIGCKPYKCPHCEYRCNCHTNLRHHVLSSSRHAGLCIYQCKMCTMGTNNAKEFQKHMIQAHNVPEKDVENIALYAGIYIKDEDTSSIAEGSQVLPVRERKKVTKTGKIKSQKSTSIEQSELAKEVIVVTEPTSQPQASDIIVSNSMPLTVNSACEIPSSGPYEYNSLFSFQGDVTDLTTVQHHTPPSQVNYQTLPPQDLTSIITQPSVVAEVKATQYHNYKTLPY